MRAMERVMFPMYLWAISTLFLVVMAATCHDHSLLENPAALFIFGDSLFDSGLGVASKLITGPMERPFFLPPPVELPMAVPFPISSERNSIHAYMTSEHAKLPLITPYLQPGIQNYNYGVNFASIGAGALLETHQGLVIDLKTQLSNFKKVEKQLRRNLGGEEGKVLLSATVYLFSIGGHDYFAAFGENSGSLVSQEEYVAMVVGNITNAIQEVYNLGGRKFGFLNVSPIGRFPFVKALDPARTGSCKEELTDVARLHNRALSQALQKLEIQLTGFKYSLHDFFTSLNEITEDPSKYGREEVEMACCDNGPYRGFSGCGSQTRSYELCENPSDFLYFDLVHPTEKAYEQFAKLFWNGSSDTTGPYNLKSLFEHDNKCRPNLGSS